MYNTLKEIQNSLSEKELYMYADKAEGKTAEEIIEMLKSDSIEISIEAAKECIDYLEKTGSILDEELENIAGGGCGSNREPKSNPEPKYKKGQRFYRDFGTTMNRRYYTIIEVREYSANNNSYLYILKPDDDNFTMQMYLDSDKSMTLTS